MQTTINFKELHKQSLSMPKEKALAMLAGAIDFEMRKPELVRAAVKHAANPHLVLVGDVKQDISLDRFKQVLGTKYNTPAATPELVDPANQLAEFYHTNMPEIDMAYELLFSLVDLRGSTHDHFDILDTNAGLAWKQKKAGEKIQIRRLISEAKATVPYLEFADGLGILDVWFQFQQWWNIDDLIAEFRSTYYDKMAELHYALLTEQGAGIDVAFDTDDAVTANKAAAEIIRATKDKGMAVGNAPALYIVCAIEKVGRLERMLTAQRGSAIVDAGTVAEPLAHRIAGIIGTTHVAAGDTGYYMVLPGRKMKRGVWKDMTIESDRDIYHKAEDITGVSQYNAAVGDSDQIRRVKFA